MEHRAWINALISPDTLRKASERIGLSHSTITRQLSRAKLSEESVVKLCREYGRSPVDGLIETGYLTAQDADLVGIPLALEKASNAQLLDEVLRRSDPDSRRLFGRTAAEINPRIDDEDGTVAQWEPHLHAADDSFDEDEGRENAGTDPLD